MRIDVTLEGCDERRTDVAVSAERDTPTARVIEALRTALEVPAGTVLTTDGVRLHTTRPWRDQIRNGAVVAAWQEHRAMPGSTTSVVVVAGTDAGLRRQLTRHGVVIGRDSPCDLVLRDPEVSRRHARIVSTGSSVRIEDASSTNGVWIDGVRVSWGASLGPDQLVRIGNTVLRVESSSTVGAAADGGGSAVVWPEPPPRTPPPHVPIASCVASLGAALAIGVLMHSVPFLLVGMIAPAILAGASAVTWLRGRRSSRRGRRDHAEQVAAAEARIGAELRAEALRRRTARPDFCELASRACGGRLVCAPSGNLLVRVGLGDQPSELAVVRDGVATSAGIVPLLPVELELAGVTHIAGERARRLRLARWLVLQACAASAPGDLELVIVADADREIDWAWARWLPQLRSRPTSSPPPPAACDSTKRVLVVDTAAPESSSDAAGVGHEDAVVSVCDQEPQTLHARIVLPNDGTADIRTERRRVRAITDGVPDDLAENLARRLAAVPGRPTGRDSPPAGAGLLRLLGDGWLDGIGERWRANDGGARTTIGTQGADPFGIDLCADGPHALVVGMTGSGKSELLQTLVAGLALNYPPDELSFALIDYKGGATFGSFAGLAHVSCVVTDLDDAGASRALVSLHAEIRRREALLAASGVTTIEEYRSSGGTPVVARLVVVIDEFAALIDDQADLTDSLRSVAQRGRSLGMHLILATQRSGSAVPADIRTNSNLRIALRITDPAESRDLVGTDAAARITAEERGSAVVGSATGATTIHGARVSVASSVDSGVQVVPLGAWRALPSEPDQHGPTDLDRIVDAVRAEARRERRVPHPAPWRPALPTCLTAADLAHDGPRAIVAFGLADRPDLQLQDRASVDLRRGACVAFVGPPRSGRTNALAVLAGSAGKRLSPAELVIHTVDACGGGLTTKTGTLPHVGTAADIDDPDQVARLMERLGAELRARQDRVTVPDPDAGEPFVLVLIDGREQLIRRMDGFDNGTTTQLLNDLMARGPSVGMSLATAGDNAPAAVAASLSDSYVLGGGTQSVPRGSVRPAGRGTPPAGRCVRSSDGAAVQLAKLDPTEPRTRWREPPAHRVVVRPLPPSVTVEELTCDTNQLLLGVGGDAATAVAVDLVAHRSRMLVCGPPSSGKSTTLISLLNQASAAGTNVCVAAETRSPLAAAAESIGLSAISPWDAHPPIDCAHGLLLVDDIDRFADSAAEDALIAVIASANRPCAVVGSGDATNLSILHRGAIAELRRSRCGLLLQPRPIDGELFGVRLRRVAPTLVPGRGVLVPDGRWFGRNGAREPMPLQVAVPESYTYPMCG